MQKHIFLSRVVMLSAVHSHSIVLSCTYPTFIPLFLFPILLPSYFFPFPCHPPPFPAPSPASSSNLFYLFSPSLSISNGPLLKSIYLKMPMQQLLSSLYFPLLARKVAIGCIDLILRERAMRPPIHETLVEIRETK